MVVEKGDPAMRFVFHTAILLVSLVTLNVPLADAQIPPKSYEVFTTLSGFYDLQSIGNPCQYIRYNRRTGFVHAIFQVALDSLDPQASRRTAYAFSPFSGYVWNNCNNLMLGSQRTTFPSLDLITTRDGGLPVVVNESPSQLNLFIDSPEGSCAFTGLSLPSPPPGFIFPEVATGADGSVIVAVSSSADRKVYTYRTTDFINWSPPIQIPGITSSLYVMQGNDSGRVGIVLRNSDGAIHFLESPNNGVTWTAPTQIIPPSVVVGADTFVTFLGADLAYLASTPVVAVTITKQRGSVHTHRDAGIGFWSPTTGFRVAVPHNRIPRVVDTLNKPQAYHLTVGYPSIGVSYNTIVIAFQAFVPETSRAGFNYSDVFATYSPNGGATWTTPYVLSYSPNADERYPSVSKWNGSGQPFIVWQWDAEPGSHIADGAPVSRSRQVMYFFIDLAVEGQPTIPERRELLQNYPNPFNPTTEIVYRINSREFVSLRVFDVLGREVATMVNEELPAGEYKRSFSAENIASGIYFYQFKAGNFSQTRRMLLLK
jgi:hypothetical protein